MIEISATNTACYNPAWLEPFSLRPPNRNALNNQGMAMPAGIVLVWLLSFCRQVFAAGLGIVFFK